MHLNGLQGCSGASTYEFVATFQGWSIFHKTGKLSDFMPARFNNTVLPIEEGMYNFSHEFTLDHTIFAGEYTLNLQIKNGDEEIACYEFDASVHHSSETAVSGEQKDATLDLSYLSAHHEVTTLRGVQKTWTAGFNENFKGDSLQDVADLCGTFLDREEEMTLPAASHLGALSDDDLPENFDAREAFPQCAGVIGHVRDQSNCGSCWAFGSTEAFNDRLCVATNGDFQQLLSTQHVTSCCNFFHCFSFGCSGGQPTNAWKYFKSYGVVSGGDYADNGADDTCWPYAIKPCKGSDCASASSDSCLSSCKNSKYTTPFTQDKHFAKEAYSIKGEENIMRELVKYGTVTGAFTVYADFPTYTGGVYQHTSGSQLGGHAIKIFGYGVENGVKYWHCMNSWTEDWGDKGTFKILRGENHCGIEATVSAGIAKTN